jgi:hypothetical protein
MSKLSIKRKQVETSGGYGPKPFWEVSVDGQYSWSYAKPFSASTAEIILNECVECYCCGIANTWVRRAGRDKIVWLRTQDGNVAPEFDCGDSMVFDREEYEREIGDGSCADLPELSSIEVQCEIQSQVLPAARSALYRIPDDSRDPAGANWLRAIAKVVEDMDGHVQVVEAPASYREVRVGLDVHDVPEAISCVGGSSDGNAILLVAFPRFPLWLTSSGITDVLKVPSRETH